MFLENKRKIFAIAIFATIIFVLFYFGGGWIESFYYTRGVSAYRANDFPTAKNYFEKAAFWNPRDPMPHAYLGRVAFGPAHPEQEQYFPEAKFAEAIGPYEKTLSLGIKEKNFSFYGSVLDDLAFSHWMTGNPDTADKIYLEKIKEFPTKSFWPRYLVALDYMDRINKPREALEILQPALLSTRNDYDNRYAYKHYALLARLKLFFEMYPEAKTDATEAITIGKDSHAREIQTAHAILAAIAGKEKNFTTAENEIAFANRLAEKQIFDCTLASAYARGENYKKSVEIATRVAPLTTGYNHSICLISLAQSKLMLGAKDDAEKYFKEYLRFTDGFKNKNIFTVRNRETAKKELEKLTSK